jgi:ABC-type nickel/cobalt efflux system permease component RcnA
VSVIELGLKRADWAPRTLLFAKLAVALSAVAVLFAALTALSWLLATTGVVPPTPKPNPFGIGSSSASSNVSAAIVAIQAQFYGALTATVLAMKSGDAQVLTLATVGFLYGIFHAAGPGHGKGVISGYIIATGGSIYCGLGLSFSSALLQATVAISLVSVFALLLGATSATISTAANIIELTSFAAVAGLGAVLVWSKSSEFVGEIVKGPERSGGEEQLPIRKSHGWKEFCGVVLAAGIRPCSGAIILLVFTLSQGIFVAGIFGALAMAIGTAITTSTLGIMTVFARGVFQRLIAANGSGGVLVLSGIEVMAAAGVMTIGLVLLAGQWVGGVPHLLD